MFDVLSVQDIIAAVGFAGTFAVGVVAGLLS